MTTPKQIARTRLRTLTLYITHTHTRCVRTRSLPHMFTYQSGSKHPDICHMGRKNGLYTITLPLPLSPSRPLVLSLSLSPSLFLFLSLSHTLSLSLSLFPFLSLYLCLSHTQIYIPIRVKNLFVTSVWIICTVRQC